MPGLDDRIPALSSPRPGTLVRVRRAAWIVAGALCVATGVVGIVLPLLPTTPFMLLAAFCFARGSRRLHDWLLAHPRLGPPIENWHRHGAISAGAKRAAILAMGFVFVVAVLFELPLYALALQLIVLLCVGAFILSRPNPPTNSGDATAARSRPGQSGDR